MLTSVLGTSSSMPGNMQPGMTATSGTVFERDLTIGGTSAIDQSTAGSIYNPTITTAGVSNFTFSGGIPYDKTLSIDGISDFTILAGASYPETLTIAGIGSILTEVDGNNYDRDLSIDSVADVTIANIGSFGHTLSISSVSNITETALLDHRPTLSIAGLSNFTVLSGQLLYNQFEILGSSSVSQLPGFSYTEDPVSIDGVSDITQTEVRFQNLLLTIDGISDFTTSNIYTGGITLTIAGVADIARSNLIETVDSLTLTSVGFVNVENYYDILYVTTAIASFASSFEMDSNKSQTPEGVSGFSASCSGVFNRTVTQSLELTQEATLSKTTGIATHSLALTQSATVQKIINKTVSQTISLTQEAIGFRAATHTLNLSQTATCVKVINCSVTQTLNLTQSVGRQATYNLSVAQTLVFNVPRQVSAPILGSNGQFQYNQPLVDVVLIPTKCMVILGTPAKSIILPCPLFGDTQNYTGELNLKKTMTGDTFTYVKKTTTQKLKYSFNLGTYKAIELRKFLEEHSSELITLRNWKGETWFVYLTNNPFEFVHAARWQPKGERVDVTLEFEGIKR